MLQETRLTKKKSHVEDGALKLHWHQHKMFSFFNSSLTIHLMKKKHHEIKKNVLRKSVRKTTTYGSMCVKKTLLWSCWHEKKS